MSNDALFPPIFGGSGGNGITDNAVDTYTASGDTELDIPLGTQNFHLLSGYVIPGSDVQDLRARFTTDGFSTVISAAASYGYADRRVYPSSAAITASDSATYMQLATSIGNAAGEFLAGDIKIWFPQDTAVPTTLKTNHTRRNGTPTTNYGHGGGLLFATTAVNGIRLYMGSGTLTAQFTLYSWN